MSNEKQIHTEVVDIDDLIQDDHNFNKGTEEGAELIGRSFKEHGAGRSVFIDKNNRLVGGNKAQKGFKGAGYRKVVIIDSDPDTLVAVRRKDVDLDTREGREMALLDNLTTERNLQWDPDELAAVETEVPDFDAAEYGWEPPTMEGGDTKQERQEVTEDDFNEETEHVEKRCTTGDIWQLGAHRLCCGDSTSKEVVQRLMAADVADMVFTDPPYGIDYSGGRTQVVRDKDYGKLKNDDLQGAELGNLICNVFEFNKDGADVYICVSPIMQKPFLDHLESIGKKTDAVIVWDKRQPGLGYMAYRRQCEFILFVKGGKFHKGDKSDVDLWSIGRDDGTTYVHGTQKPVGVSGRAIQNSSKEGDIVLDYFGGSGSTLIACEQLNRQCRMMELDPHFCDVILARWEKLTGQKAIKLNP